MEPLRVFERFKLDELDKNWVKSVWENDFMIYDTIPSDYLLFAESDDMELLLKETCATIKEWISINDNERDSRSEVSWQTLCALNVNQNALLALLGFIIKTGQDLDADEDSRQACLQATSLYLALLAIPGSSAYQVFHENLYDTVINTLQLAEHLIPIIKKPIKSMDLESLYIDEEEPAGTLRQTEKITLTKGLNVIMYNMILMLKSWCLRDHVRSLEQTVHSLIEITKLGVENYDGRGQNRYSDNSLMSLAHNSYAALAELCHSRHGPVDVTIKLISKYFLPHLLANYTSLPTKLLNIVRDTTIGFLRTLLHDHQKSSETGVRVLIQHMMITCPERLEARQKQAGVLVKLINICVEPLYTKVIKDLILFSQHSKISCRIFAQEIISKLLDSSNEYEEAPELIALQLRFKKVLFASVFSRCLDTSSMVRGRAMATLAEYTEVNDRPLVVELFHSTDQRPLPTLQELRQALIEDLNLLPDLKTVMSMIKARAQDDRAAVRRNAIQFIRNVVLNVPELLDDVIPIVSLHSRDPAMTVRRFSIQVLTTLLEKFPNHGSLHEQWVKSVVPQVFDVEVRVQEKVLEVLENLTIKRISSGKTDDLPWKIVNNLTQFKMRRHLVKSCDVWVQSGIISDSIITTIVSHLDTENNIAAWTLLSAIGETKRLPQMKKYLEDYKKLLEGTGFHEYLALEVLRSCWPIFDNSFLKKLVRDFSISLLEFSVSTSLISLSLDIVCAISTHLSPTNCREREATMQKIMKECETIIAKIIKDHDHSTDDIETYLKAMCTLGHASFLCTRKINLPVLRILQGILIDWESMPETIKGSKEIQAATVVILGQQAMREQTIAYEMMPVFGQLLCSSTTEDAAVRVNAAKALADVCTRFTTLVEPYLPDMCISMKNGNSTVREAIVVIFIQLFVEDFIKVKESFFFHILTMLSDPDDTIREMTVFLIKERLLVKNKTLISQQFLEAILHYNDFEITKKYCERKMQARERAALTLPGNKNETKRRMIYDFMLEHLDLPGKLKLLVRLTTQVLNGIIGGSIKIRKEKGICVLKDTLYIISSNHLQASSCTTRQCDDELDDVSPSPPNHVNVIVEGIKKHGLQILLPALLKLMKKLSTPRYSSVSDDVNRVFVKIGSDYSKDQLASLGNEFPEINKKMEYLRKNGTNCQFEMNPIDRSTPKSHPLLDCNRTPRVVLRRVSVSSIQESPRTSQIILARSTPSRELTATPKSSRATKYRRF